MMKKLKVPILISFLAILFYSCNKEKEAIRIIQGTIRTIDTIERIYYKQDMSRTNPRDETDTIFRYREMYFARLRTDSIVGVKGHWYMYVHNREDVLFEDIYDGNKLIRKNNRDSIIRKYDLVKFPDFRENHFWGHNTLYGMQYEFEYILNNIDHFIVEKLGDTLMDGRSYYQIRVKLENHTTMPGFAVNLVESAGSVSSATYTIDKNTYYPVMINSEFWSAELPESKIFLVQKYYDLEFNLQMDEDQFNTSDSCLSGFTIKEMKPN